MIRAALSSRSTGVHRTRGVITSAAVISAKPSDRVTSWAVPGSSVPASAERSTIEASSSGVRAPDSSSCGSMPKARRTRLALPLSSTINGWATIENTRMNGVMNRAVASGADRPRNCGTSSPTTIEKAVARTRAMRDRDRVDRTVRDAEAGQRRLQQAGHARLDQEADQQRGQRDADLRRGQLGRQLAQRGQHGDAALVAVGDGPLDGAAVEGDVGELGGDEDRRCRASAGRRPGPAATRSRRGSPPGPAARVTGGPAART